MKPRQRLENNLKKLQEVNEDLFELYKEAKLDRNKRETLNIKLEVMHSIGKLKKFLNIPVNAEEKETLKKTSLTEGGEI